MPKSLLLLVLLPSCLGVPTTLRPGVGVYDNGIGEPYMAYTVEADVPISYPWREELPAGDAVSDAERASLLLSPETQPKPKSQQSAVQQPWWEDFASVQNLLILVMGWALGEARKPVQAKMQGKKS